MIEYPLIVVEIPHQSTCIVYQVMNRDNLINLLGDIKIIDYDEIKDDDYDLLEKLTNDNHTSFYLNFEEAKDFAFNDKQAIYEGHKQYESIRFMQKYLQENTYLFEDGN